MVELTRADIIADNAPAVAGADFDLKKIESVLNMVMGIGDKIMSFREKYNRNPSKEELKFGVASNQLSAPTSATQDKNIKNLIEENQTLKQQLQEITSKNIFIKIDDNKLDEVITSLFLMVEDIPETYKNMSLSQILTFKGMFKSKIKSYIKEKIPEVVTLETR